MLQRARHDERGAGYIAAFIVLFSVVLVAGVGILVDSARYWSSYRRADSVAMEAARAGANALDVGSLRDGQVIVDPAQAQSTAAAAASAFVTGSGATLQSVSVSGDQVTVVVSAQVNAWFPLMGDRTVTREATASANRAGP